MKKARLRIFSFVMSLITLMMFCIPINSMETTLSETQENDISDNAELPHYIIGEPSEDENFDTDMEWLKNLGVGEKTLAELKNMRVEDAELHEIIAYETALTKGHVHRLKEQETDLNTVIYQNQDGTTTKYIFTKPVKYIDNNGQIRDKSKKISSYTENGYTYAMTENSTKVYFPEFAENGIGIEFSGDSNYRIYITPIANSITSTIGAVKQDDNTVVYSDIFGENTDVVYTTQFSGLKEDIVLEEYTGQSVFRFELTTEGIVPENVDGKWVLKNSNEFIIAEFSDIIVKDSQGKTIFGSLDIIQRNDRYDMYVTVDDSFLQSPDTVYPVYIDPSTVYIGESYYYRDFDGNYFEPTTIYDVGVYDAQSSNAENNTEYHYVGGDFPEGIIIYKLPDFYLAEAGRCLDFNEYEVGKVTMSIYVEASEETTLGVYPLSSTWDISVNGENPTLLIDSERTWHEPTYVYTYRPVYIDSGSGTYEIDITDIVKGWTKYNFGKSNEAYMNPENGFVLISNGSCRVRSTEYSYEDDIYIEIDYDSLGGESYIYSLNSYKSLQDSQGSVTVNTFNADHEDMWIFDYLGNEEFYIRSATEPNKALVPSGTLVTLSQMPQDFTDNYKWTNKIAINGGVLLEHVSTGYVLNYDGSSLRIIASPQGGTTVHEQSRWGLLNVEAYIPILDVELKDNWVATGTSKYFNLNVTPSNATLKREGMFTWSISDMSKVSLSSYPNMLYGGNPGKVTLTLKHKLSGYTKTFTITCGAIREGNYIIRNIATSCNFDICGPYFDDNTIIHQWEYHEGIWSRWEINLHDNGYYTIRSTYTGKYIHVLGASTSNGADIVQYEGYGGDNTYWYITAKGDGRYTISPKSNRSLVLGIPSGSTANGVHIQQIYEDGEKTQWAFDNVGMTMTLKNGGVYNIVAKHSNKALDVTYAGTANGTIVNQYDATPGYQWQRWKLQYYGDGAYKIIDMNSGKLMSISASSPYSNEVCHIWADDGTTGQLFRIRENRDGSYSLLSKCSNYQYVLSVGGGSTENGQIAYQYFDLGENYQKFSFIESNKAIIIVPGLGGSVLKYGDTEIFSSSILKDASPIIKNLEQTIKDFFHYLANADELENMEDLIALFTNDLSDESSIKAMRAIIKLTYLAAGQGIFYNYTVSAKPFNAIDIDSRDSYGCRNTYKNLYLELQKIVDMNPNFENGSNIYESSKYRGYDITIFTYDWRLSCATNAGNLEAFIENRGYDKVVLVGHSMGGLVASGYMARGETQRQKVEEYVSFGTPYWGAPVASAICMTGDISVWLSDSGEDDTPDYMKNAIVKEFVIENMLPAIPSIYDLLPTKEYVEHTGGYLTYKFISEVFCDTYESTKEKLSEKMAGYSESQMAAAEAFHDSVYINGKHVATMVKHTFVYSRSIKTVTGVYYEKNVGLDDYCYTIEEQGDGTVPQISANMNEMFNILISTKGHTKMVEEIETNLLNIIF